VLSVFYTMCMSHAYLPPNLMRTIVVPIVKDKTGDISDPSNYRPISLATVLAKVLDGVLDTVLDKYIQVHDTQFGFRTGLSTESAILSLKHTVQYYVDRGTPVYACFLDLSRAFDLVSYKVLWRKIRDRGVPSEICDLLQYWYSNQTNYVKWDDCVSDPYRLDCGVRQGGLTSPRLFNLYIDALIDELSSKRVGCGVGGVSINNISYADDMVLLGPSVKAIRELLKVCEAYAESHGLTYNVKKCEYMVFEVRGKHREDGPDLLLNGFKIKKVSSFKYLGHVIADDLKDNLDIERERRALAVRSNMLARRFARCTDQVKITLFKSYCQSLYTGNLWVNYTKKTLDILRVQYNNAFRMLLGLPRYCSASEMFAQARTDGFHAIIRKKTASLLRRVRDSPNGILRTVAENNYSPILRKFYKTCIA
jgi:retron-type reverse transcriptase